MAQSSFPQCRREGVQYRISTTENAQEEIWYSQNEIPIAMFTQRYQPHLGDHIPIHWHQEMQLLWVYDGTLSYRVNGMEFPLDRSQLLFINDSILHSAHPITTEVKTLCINFRKDIFPSALWNQFLRPLTENPYCTYELINLNAQSLDKLGRFIHHVDDSTGLFSVTTFIMEVMEEIMETFEESGEAKNTEERVLFDGILSFIKDHFSESLTISQLSTAAHLNKNKLTALFQKYTGMPPIHFLNTYRLDEARTQLLKSARSVSEISEDVGYGQISHFIQQFRKRYGMTPLQYRRTYSGRDERYEITSLL